MRITQCPECKAQYRIPDAHVEIVSGRSASCKKCRARFVVQVAVVPDPVPPQVRIETPASEATTAEPATETAATAAESAVVDTPARRHRRTNAELRQERIHEIRSSFRALHGRLAEIYGRQDSTEEDVRRWVIDALRHGLGYEDRDIRTEERANDRRVDITVRAATNGSPTMVFEVKGPRKPLNARVIDQAASYAAVLNAPYAVVTNGDAWVLLKSATGHDGRHRLIEIFNLALLDEDGVSEDDAESLFLLTKKAVTGKITETQCHRTAASQPARIWKALQEEATLGKLKRTICAQYEEEFGIRLDLDTDDLLKHLEDLVVPDDL